MTDQSLLNDRRRVPVAAIGASAGGITALQTLFEALPAKVGAAFVVIVHLDPEHQSELPRIIAARTRMPVVEVDGERPIEADKIYVIPPNRQLRVSAERISSMPFDEPRGQRAPIDHFFRSVADEHGDGFAIILTGAGTDGAVGVKAVKEAGGLILVQDPEEAEYPSMPRGANASGVADFILPVREIAKRLPGLVVEKRELAAEVLGQREEEVLVRILAHLRMKTGNDFSHYKRATVLRRLARRMQVARTDTFDEYFSRLRDSTQEVEALLAELVISVTSFFRDPEAFQALARDVIPRLFDDAEEKRILRVWVAGCATGEEAFSVLILLLEELARHEFRPDIQMFASDLDPRALAIGREGIYPVAIEADVSEERLRKFFIREGDHYRIRREVRDMIVFAPHSLLRDPPFSHIDLISCRNLLIYLDRDLQNQVCRTFHYALRPHGYLFLGSSESIESHGLFHVIDRDARIFQSMEHAREMPPVTRVLTGARITEPMALPFAQRESRGNFTGEHRQALEHFAPPSVLVDEAHRILNVSETAGRFLLQPAGPISNLAADLVRPELRLDLQAGLYRAFDEEEATLTLPIPVRFDGEVRQVSLHVRPIARDGVAPAAAVIFMEGKVIGLAEAEPHTQEEGSSKLVAQLRSELASTQAHLRTSREQFETINEELRASNEELQSTNEEYRSTSEELETSKEELQSINEELQTLNNELKVRLDAVSRAHSDLQNLMAATDVATLFLDPGLRIHRFTPRISDLFNVTAGDEGRQITDFTHRLDYSGLVDDAERILTDLIPIERTIRTLDGHWLLMRIRPYRTMDDRIDGIVVTFVDVTDQHNAEETWEKRQRMLVAELSHRFKNALTVVQSVVAEALRLAGIDGEVQRTIADRLRALARTHDLLVTSETGSIELGALARDQLAPHLTEAGRVRLEGPPVQLARDLAMSFGLLLHELGTNAAKHGALSKPSGRIAVAWEVIEAEHGKRVRLVWTEHGGPAVRPPTKSGFGTVLIEHGLPDAQVKRDFRREGLVCTIELPLRAGNDNGEPPAT